MIEKNMKLSKKDNNIIITFDSSELRECIAFFYYLPHFAIDIQYYNDSINPVFLCIRKTKEYEKEFNSSEQHVHIKYTKNSKSMKSKLEKKFAQ